MAYRIVTGSILTDGSPVVRATAGGTYRYCNMDQIVGMALAEFARRPLICSDRVTCS